MSSKVEGVDISQLPLFDISNPSTGAFELFPKIWAASEALTSPNPKIRIDGLVILDEYRAARFSSLICYLIYTRLGDPDIEVRKRVISSLVNVLRVDNEGNSAPEMVYQNLKFHLSQLQEPTIYGLLETCEEEPDIECYVADLLRQSSHAGEYLSEIMNNRRYRLDVRIRATQLIGKIGFLEALPSIERAINKLEARVNGQQIFTFAYQDNNDENRLLPTLRVTYDLLTAP